MLLLLFNSSVQGAVKWNGPDPQRTFFVPAETRSFKVPAESRTFRA